MPQVPERDIPRKNLFKRRRIAVIVVPPVEELDLVGPMQVFSAANRLTGKPVYAVEIATNSDDLKVAGEGGLLSFLAQRRFAELKGSFDSLLLVCGVATRNARDAALFAWFRKMAPEVRRIGSVCVGAFLFAEAGLLNGRRATAHWKFGEELAKRYPRVRVESNPLWVKDGNIYTSAGISAGIDLALAWVEEDCGATVAHEVARELVLFLRRPGGQTQHSVSLAAQASEMKAIQELQVWIAENVRRKLSVQALADRVGMSVRNFERVFTRELGRTPSKYILQVRVEQAQRQLERTDRGLKQIALDCGFGSADVMRRSFVRLVGVTPDQYRRTLNAGFKQRSNISDSLSLPKSSKRLPVDLELMVFRVVQECVTNVHRHSGSPSAIISLSNSNEKLTLEIRDQGKGMDADRLAAVTGSGIVGVGLRGMRERVKAFGGELEIFSDARGTIVRATIPIRASDSEA